MTAATAATGEPDPTPPITNVTGGERDPAVRRAGELAASYAAARELADTYDTAGSTMRQWSGLGVTTVTNADVLESSILAPGSFALAESAVLAATTGPGGILAASVGWEADAILIRITITLFEETDELAEQAIEAADYALGRIIGTFLPGLVLTSLPLLLPLAIAGAPWLQDHPEVERHLVNGGGGLLDGLSDSLWPGPGGLPFLPPFHPTTQDAAATLAGLFGRESPARITRHDVPAPGAPTSLQDLVENLAAVNGTEADPRPEGTIAIQQVTAPGGAVHWIVYAPGTDDAAPWHHDHTVRDTATSLELIAGHQTAYGDGIEQAMHDAGIRPDDPVLIVGHSQGGMQAVNLLSHDTGFSITNVVTAGSPMSPEDLPVDDSTNVLSFENRGDIVPLLDGSPAEATGNHVTIQFDDSAAGGPAHDLGHYVHGALAADLTGNADIREQIESMAGFLGGAATGTQGYLVTR